MYLPVSMFICPVHSRECKLILVGIGKARRTENRIVRICPRVSVYYHLGTMKGIWHDYYYAD